MCGICGVVIPDAPEMLDIDAGIRLLHHRGPDSSGLFESPNALIGQTRLAVIDLFTGDPPIASEDGNIGVALNGEIYNFRELRDGLRVGGHQFKTEGDTEVLAHLSEDLDPVAVARSLNGMFAYAVYDRVRRRLVLARDRLGKKPLYYWTGPKAVVFGSEIKAVLSHAAVPRRLDPDAISDFLTFGYVPTPFTFFEGVRSVPPGHVLVVEDGRPPALEEYWSPPLAGIGGVEQSDLSLAEAALEVRRLLQRAVERRLVSDVPIGAFLSGGIDSSTVVALMAEASVGPVSTFTIGFDDEGFDERSYGRLVARWYGTDHTEFVVRPDTADLIERLVWHHDQPFGDSSALPTFLLSELTRRHVTVALAGDGGDELFAGYERFAAAMAVGRMSGVPQFVRRVGRSAAVALPPANRFGRFKRFASGADLPVPLALLAWVGVLPRDARDRLVAHPSERGIDSYLQTWGESEGGGLLDRILHLNLRTYLLDDLLPKVDRMSMAHALEVRSPYLDDDLLNFAFTLPSSARARGMSLKRVLRAAAADLVPNEIVRRRKRGFGVPLERWFRSDLRSYLEGMLGSNQSRVRDHLVPEAIDALVGEHLSGKANHTSALWSLLTLEVFLRREGW